MNLATLREPTRAASRSLIAIPVALLLTGCGGGGETGGIGGGGGGRNRATVPVDSVDLSFHVANHESTARRETICASIPFPEGEVSSTDGFAVAGHPTAWLPLQQWPDGSVRVAQAQVTVDLPANDQFMLTVERGGTVLTQPFQPHPWVQSQAGGLTLGARVHDTFDHRYESVASGDGVVLQSTSLKRVRRWRTFHESTTGGGIGRDYLSSRFYVTDFRDMPFLIVDWVVGSDYGGRDAIQNSSDPNLNPLGPVDVDNVGFLISGATEVVAFHSDWNDIDAPVNDTGGRQFFKVMDQDWFADGQTRRYRFLVRQEDPGASSTERNASAALFDGFKNGPAHALSQQQAWAPCEALGLLGGPIQGPTDGATRAEAEWTNFLSRTNNFGTWGYFSDAPFSHTTGTPRNSPLGASVAHAVQTGDLRLLNIVEQMAWVQAVRPYHVWGLQVGADEEILLYDGIPVSLSNRFARDFGGESLGRRELRANDPWPGYRTRVDDGGRPHDFNPYDFQHWSTDQLFEYWTLFGDEWARDELAQLGEHLKGIARLDPQYLTGRGVSSIRAEAWTMQSFVQIYQVTRDDSLKTYAVRRATEVVNPDRRADHPSRAMGETTPDGRDGFPDEAPDNYIWYAPWPNAFTVYGYTAAYRFFDSELCLTLAEDAIRSIKYASVANYTDPNTGQFVPFALRYGCVLEVAGVEVPATYFDNTPGYSISFSGGTARPTTSAAALIQSWSNDAGVRAMGDLLTNSLLPQLSNHDRWDKWVYTMPERVVPAAGGE